MVNQDGQGGHDKAEQSNTANLPGWVVREVRCVIKDMQNRAIETAEDRKLGYIQAVIDMERMFKDRGFDL
jgi:hypothetical protein